MTPLIELQCFPSIYYFAVLLHHGEVSLEAHEHYQKGSYRNKYEIAGPNGRQTLSLPLLKGKHSGMPIKSVGISYEENWPLQHWRSLQTAYGNSPFFLHYKDELKAIITSGEQNLWTWNKTALNWVCQQVEIEIRLEESQSFQKESGKNDYRNQIRPSKEKIILPEYPQVFMEKTGFLTNLSILDLLFCMGPICVQYLQKIELSERIIE
ncbi:MAG: hypothetical protein HKN16_01525 [Saprospiraceae bacterium]|nr:hypothetical protein [Saprospiraceae bacterium]